MDRWKKENPDKLDEYKKRKYQFDPEKRRDRQKRYEIKVPEKRQAINRRYDKAHRVERSRAGVERARRHPEKYRLKNRSYYHAQREKLSVYWVKCVLKVKEPTAEMIELTKTRFILNSFLRKAKTIKEKTNVNIPCNA
jgi:hypothetical protein